MAITGGIGSGKSYVCRLLEERGIPVFYTDDEAKEEMRHNERIHAELRALIGNDVIDAQGRLVKALIADFICGNDANARAVNQIVHPRVRERMHRWLDNASSKQCSGTSGLSLVAVECALLFEAGWEGDVDKVITVAAPESVRLHRIMQRDHISESKAREWIRLQISQEEKIRRSHFVIINDGVADLQNQIDEILNRIGAE